MQLEKQENFECNRCGKCCKSNKLVPLTLDDIFRISDFIDLHPDDFLKRYCVEMPCGDNTTPMPYLKREGEDCCFLKDGLCAIHFVKPGICKLLPSTIFGSVQYLRSKMPQTCAVQRSKSGEKINETDSLKEGYMVSMILTTIYYSTHYSFKFDLAKPYIYRILLVKKNRKQVFDMVDDYSQIKN